MGKKRKTEAEINHKNTVKKNCDVGDEPMCFPLVIPTNPRALWSLVIPTLCTRKVGYISLIDRSQNYNCQVFPIWKFSPYF